MPLFAERYELGAVIGQGGMAEVRSAVDTRLERPVAIKLMRPELATQPTIRARFESEARMAVRLSHPNVVVVFDSGEADGIPFIVMERLSGESLQDWLRSGPMRQADVRELGLQVLSALESAHAAGVLHRDIKPANVLVAGDGRWKVADFGIAKALEPDASAGDATATGLVLGTPAYLAPERLFGAPATVASDLYSVGVILYQALTGRRPFETERAEAWAGVVATTPVTPIQALRPDVDPALAAAVERSLAKEPEGRFASAAEMAAAMTGAMAPPAEATAVMTTTPATEVLSAIPPPPTGVVPVAVERAGGRWPGPALVILAAIVAVAVVVALIASDHHSGGSPTTGSTTTAVPTSAPTSSASSTSTTTTSPTTTPTTVPATTASTATTALTVPPVTIPVTVATTAAPTTVTTVATTTTTTVATGPAPAGGPGPSAPAG